MKKILLVLIIIPLLYNCSKPQSDKSSKKKFNLIDPDESGINFSNDLVENDSLNYFTYGYMYMGGGVSAGDINNDGLIDLYFTGNMTPNKLYLNKGNLKFEDISDKAGVAGDSKWFTGVTMADVNSDGYLDIYCSVAGKFEPRNNVLFINNGDQTFTESAKKYGIDDIGNSIQSTFFDYDLDGDLDLYVANYPRTNFDAPNSYYLFKMGQVSDEESDKLYRNDGDHFTNVTNEAHLRSFGLTNSATIGDVNNDGWPDIYVSNDFNVPDYLFINNSDGTFSEHIRDVTKQTSLFGMGTDIADFNNDQLLDIIQMDMTPADNRRSKANMASMNPDIFWGTVNIGFGYQYMQNMLQMNMGMINDSLPKFSNVSRIAGLATTDWSWGPLFVDLDNDGWKDIFISNGTRREINNKDYFNKLKTDKYTKDSFLIKSLAIPSERVDNFVFKNNGDLTFDKMNDEWGLIFEGFSNGSAYADLDNDGDLEIIINNIDDPASVFNNHSSEINNHLTLRFIGPEKNKSGLGVKTTLSANGMKQFQELTLTRGFQSSVAPQIHFGLGTALKADSLKVIWPDGKSQLLTNIDKNQILTIKHADASIEQLEKKSEIEPLFTTITDTSIIAHHKHSENEFDDFAVQVLLPHKMSEFGPGLSVGDLNNDGLDDLVIGGASQYKSGIYFQTEKGFIKKEFDDISKDRGFEDLGSYIFDADNDGDNDIYMVSGGYEFSPDSEMLQDRLYINDGGGNFSKSTTALPQFLTSGSRVYGNDFDKDGDIDLFIGGRMIPQNYPLAANSHILENISTNGEAKFIDATEKVAPELMELGMVTSASWSDIDKDGWTDLVIVGEWMPVTVFKNNQGNFENITTKLDLNDSTGWFFSIKEGDFDNDGDIDFIAGNLGLNYKYKANAEESFDIYVNDFDKNQSNDIVLSYFSDGEKFPVRGRECSSQQIPAIKKKFKNYDDFSTATLEDVYTEKDLNSSLHYQVKSFASIYIENQGDQFIIHNLPVEAQLSSVNQIIVDDFNNDSNLDLVIAGNLYSSEVETPRNDAMYGLQLNGDGKGNFTTIKNHSNGLLIDGDTKDLVTIQIKGNDYIVAGRNDDYIQFIKINK